MQAELVIHHLRNQGDGRSLSGSVRAAMIRHVCLIRNFMFHHSTVPQPPKPYSEAPSWHLDASNGYARKTVAASASLANSAGKVISWIGGEKNNWRQKTINHSSALSKVSRFQWFLMNTAPAHDEMTSRWLTHQCRAEVTGPWKDLQKGGLSWVVLRCLWLHDRHFSSAIKNKSSNLNFTNTLCDYLRIVLYYIIFPDSWKQA